MARIRANNTSGGGGVQFASGEYDLDSSKNTPIPCGFQPKTITYDTMNGSYRQNILWDEDLIIYNNTHEQVVHYTSNNSTTHANVGDTTGARIISIDPVGSANNPTGGFTVGKGGSTYGTKCNYKAYG